MIEILLNIEKKKTECKLKHRQICSNLKRWQSAIVNGDLRYCTCASSLRVSALTQKTKSTTVLFVLRKTSMTIRR